MLSALPKSAHPGAKRALAEIWNAEDRDHARRAVAAFKLAYGAKFGKAVAKITDDLDELLAFYDFPAEHWVHLRTTNPSRPSRPCVTGPRSPKAPVRRPPAWRWRSNSSRPAQARWRAVNAPKLVALVRAGTRFERGKLVERPALDTTAVAA